MTSTYTHTQLLNYDFDFSFTGQMWINRGQQLKKKRKKDVSFLTRSME